jgi:membrane protein required for colicin V production
VIWLDWVIVAFVAASVLSGFKEGFIRLGIGFVALIAGFVLASWFYGVASEPLLPYVKLRPLANLIGFQAIFFSVVLIGALIAAAAARMFHLIGLSFVDRVLGGAFAAVRAAFILVVVTMGVMAFAPKWIPAAAAESRLAPYIIRSADVFSAATPYELKQGFAEALEDIQGMIKGLNTKKFVVRQE